jgi:hypothetical protein
MSMPSTPGIQKIKLSGVTQASMSQSPFSGGQQIFEWPAEWWLADVTLPPMTRAGAEPWNAMLLALRGRSGTLLLGDSAVIYPQGSILRKNLVRDSDVGSLNFYWAFNASLPIVGGAGAVSGNGFRYTGTGAASGFVFTSSQIIEVVPGKQYSFSGYIDATHVTSGTPGWHIFSPDILTSYITFQQTAGVSGRVSGSWVAPVGVKQVVALCDTDNCTVANATSLTFSNPQLEVGALTAYQTSDASLVSGTNASGSKTLAIRNGIPSLTQYVRAGDYIQVGTGTTQRLYKSLTDQATDGSGNLTMDIFPRLRETLVDTTPFVIERCKGSFRLASNQRGWDTDEALIYGVQFQAIEAL